MKTLLATALVLLAATPAFAHAHLVSAEPADAAIVTAAPTSLTLEFSERIELGFSGVTLTGPAGPVAAGAAYLDHGDAGRLVVPLDAPLAAGPYSVDWHTLSSDGHKSRGTYAFTVK